MAVDRLALLRARIADLGVDALLVSNNENRRYITGFTGSAGHALVTQDLAILLVDSRYVEQASLQTHGWDVRLAEQTFGAWLAKELPALGVSRVTLEAGSWTLASYRELLSALVEADVVVDTSDGAVERLRERKDAEEIAALTRAVQVTDQGFANALVQLRPGLTEKAFASIVEQKLRECGAEGMAFEVIVASGPNSAMPHHRPTDRIIEAGDVVLCDLGGVVAGYHGDLTRTVCLGAPSDRYREVWDIVLEAQERAALGAKPGMRGKEVDALARDYIAERGFKDRFGHSLGHGVGLEIHEDPRVSVRGEAVLEVGMVFTVEPGIYLPGEFGVRIEDIVVLGEGGASTLTRSPKSQTLRSI